MDLLLPFLTSDFLGKPAWVWLAFVGIVVALLVSALAGGLSVAVLLRVLARR